MKKNILEICCYNLESAMIAADAGADRIELCADPSAGGTTPGIGLDKIGPKKNQNRIISHHSYPGRRFFIFRGRIRGDAT